ncbi:unnamed protein product, partial [Amoebophrya sp. A25]|eukprot:GSA25T00011874001.1
MFGRSAGTTRSGTTATSDRRQTRRNRSRTRRRRAQPSSSSRRSRGFCSSCSHLKQQACRIFQAGKSLARQLRILFNPWRPTTLGDEGHGEEDPLSLEELLLQIEQMQRYHGNQNRRIGSEQPAGPTSSGSGPPSSRE